MAYIDIGELQRVLQKTGTTAEQAAMQRCLDAAAQECDSELGYSTESPAPLPPPPLLAEVNLERAVELWKQSFQSTGAITVGQDPTPIIQPYYTWKRHAIKLQPLKMAEGVA